jgi:hypothetical protein
LAAKRLRESAMAAGIEPGDGGEAPNPLPVMVTVGCAELPVTVTWLMVGGGAASATPLSWPASGQHCPKSTLPRSSPPRMTVSLGPPFCGTDFGGTLVMMGPSMMLSVALGVPTM